MPEIENLEVKTTATKKPSLRRALQDAIEAMGLDRQDPELFRTPERIEKFWMEYMQPFKPEELFERTSEARDSNMIVLGPLEFRMLCCHHFAPANGHAWIGYVPHKKLLGLSKFPRLVLGVALQRPSLQEYINDEIAELIDEYLEPKGVMVVIKAQHSCMTSRGIAQPNGMTATSSIRGVFRDVTEAREEFFHLINT